MVPITPRVQTSDQMGKRNRRNEHEMHILGGNIHFGIYRRPCPAIGPMGLNNSEVGAVLREVRTQLNKERLVRRDLDNALSIFAMEAIMEAITCRRLLEAMSCRGGKVLLQVTALLGPLERKYGWEAGIRTPIGGSRVRSLTVRRPPTSDLEFT